LLELTRKFDFVFVGFEECFWYGERVVNHRKEVEVEGFDMKPEKIVRNDEVLRKDSLAGVVCGRFQELSLLP
jgi:hypothetical protein